MLWSLQGDAHSADKSFPKRSGYVPVLGISPDGKRVLYDPSESKALRILSLPEGLHEGIIRNAPSSPGIRGLALFSPDGRFVLAGEGTEARLQLWTAPAENSRSFEVCKLAMNEPSKVTCAAFAPDGSFVVAGTKDRQVLVWGPLPSEKEVANVRIPAVISNIDRSIDPGRSQVRVFAEFRNPQGGKEGLGLLMPGDVVNLVIPAAR
jgi:WD40 repeat protein